MLNVAHTGDCVQRQSNAIQQAAWCTQHPLCIGTRVGTLSPVPAVLNPNLAWNAASIKLQGFKDDVASERCLEMVPLGVFFHQMLHFF
jgi:hypothetical protein